jgi:hypothetical protein
VGFGGAIPRDFNARTSQIWEKVGWPGGGGGRGGGATVPSSTSAMDGGAGVSAAKHKRQREDWSWVGGWMSARENSASRESEVLDFEMGLDDRSR